MKTLIIVIIALILGTLLAVFSVDDPGVVVLARAPHRIELPLALFAVILVAAFAILYLLFNFLFGFFATPKKIKKWNASRRNRQAQADTLRGYAQLIEGDWQKGEKHLTKRMKECKTPLLNYLGAAYAAQQQQDFSKRDHYLDKAEQIDPSNRMAVDLTRARLLSQAGQFDEAKSLLETMHPLAPANTTILRLMADVYRQSGDTAALAGVLPKLEKTRALSTEQCAELDILCRADSAQLALTDQAQPSVNLWVKEWKALPSAKKKNPAMAALYGQRLIDAGELIEAEKLLRTALKKNWDSALVAMYGLSRAEKLAKQLKYANTWLPVHDDDANVHLTLARLNLTAEHFDQAETHYQKAIQLGAGEEAFYELGEYFESKNDRKAALALYKKGVQSSIALHQAHDGLAADSTLLAASEMDSVITLGSSETGLVAAGSASSTEAMNKADEPSDAEVIEVTESASSDDAASKPLIESK